MENPEDRSARTLRAVSDIGQTMVSDADYEQVLAALIEKVCGLLDAESGGFMLYEPAAGELQLQRPAFGLDDDDDRTDLAKRLAELIQLDVVVCEAGGQPMVATGARRRLPAEVAALLRRATEGPVTQHQTQRVGLDQGGDAVVTRITAGGESVGAIVVLCDGDIAPETIRTIEQATLVMAITIVKQREVAEVERRLRADALEHLLVASTTIEEAGLLRRLGIEAGAPFRMAEIVVTGAASQRQTAIDTDFQRLHRLVSGLLRREWPGAVAVTRSSTVTLVLPASPATAGDARRRLERVLED